MKKNLKKVISAVLALTLAMSSFVALSTTTSAAAFTDVKETASYAEAVNALEALGVFTGYGDGTFKPDNKITRAEAITMIVNANGIVNESGEQETTKFADVNSQAAWAGFYVNQGVQNGFISGMSDTEFGPSLNVNYAMVLTMLTKMLGYQEYALSRGGYPDGYMESARHAEIMTGVSAAETTELTRAQVAQLIWNAVKAPKVYATQLSTNINSGNWLEKMDGTTSDRTFHTVLSDVFNAYVMDVRVDSTAKTNSGTMDNDEVGLSFINKKDYNPKTTSMVVVGTDSATANVGETDIADYLFSSGKTVVEYVDDEWKVIYFAPTNRVATKTVDGELINTTATLLQDGGNNVLAINRTKYTTANPTKYYLSDGVELYVNGVKYATVGETTGTGTVYADAAALEADIEAVIASAEGDVVLYEDTTAGVVGTKYNKISVQSYALASVNQVQTNDTKTTIRLSGLQVPAGAKANTQSVKAVELIADDIADGKMLVSITKNDSEVEATALVKNDVVAIQYDITSAFAGSKEINIIATDEKVTGKYNAYDVDESTYDISGTMYEASGSMPHSLGSGYTFRLDPFGKLFAYEEDANVANYAIVERYVDRNDGQTSESYIEVVTLDGKTDILYLDKDYETATARTLLRTTMGIKKTAELTVEGYDANGDGDTTDSGEYAGIPLQNRIISYTVRNSTQKVNKIEVSKDIYVSLPSTTFKVEVISTATEYNEAAQTLGKRVSADATVLDATKYDESEFAASSLSALDPSIKYEAILVHQSNAAYKYVVITAAGTKYGPASDFTVMASDASSLATATDADGLPIYSVRVVAGADSDAATKVMTVADDAKVSYHNGSSYVEVAYTTAYTQLQKGAAFFYTTDSEGHIDRFDVVLKGGYTFANLVNGLADIDTPDTASAKKIIAANDWEIGLTPTWSGEDNEIQMFVAPVILANDGAVTFSSINTSGAVDYIDTVTTSESFALTSAANIYSYDLSTTAGTDYRAFGQGAFDGIDLTLTDDGKAYISTLGDTVAVGEEDFNGVYQMAFVMVVDGVITNAIVFNN